MQIVTKAHTAFINDIKNANDSLQEITSKQAELLLLNVVIDLSQDAQLSLDDVKLFSALAKEFKKKKKSFVLVANQINLNKVPAAINVVPTVLEAEDLIEMEEIERDLGF